MKRSFRLALTAFIALVASSLNSGIAQDVSDRFFYGSGKKRTTMFVAVDGGLPILAEPSWESEELAVIPDGLGVCINKNHGEKTGLNNVVAPWIKIYVPYHLQKKVGSEWGWVFGGYLKPEPLSSLGISADNNQGKDFATIEKAANEGNSLAQCKLGEYYKLGLGTAKDYVKAAEYYKKASEQDEPMAFRNLAALYALGLGVQKSNNNMWYYVRETNAHGAAVFQDYWDALAQKDLEAYLVPDDYYSYGRPALDCLAQGFYRMRLYDMSENLVTACFTEPARKGNAIAQLCLAHFYASPVGLIKDYYGKNRIPDEEKAKKWYDKAASQGYTSDNAVFKQIWEEFALMQEGKLSFDDFVSILAELMPQEVCENASSNTYYAFAKRVRSDDASFRWMQRAAELGHVDATYDLGRFYAWGGQGVQKDAEKAASCYESALTVYRKEADQGDPHALLKLGDAYRIGGGVPPDCNKAIQLYKKAASLGNAESMFWIGFLYEYVDLENNDLAGYDKAVYWYKQASALENAAALHQLGEFYEVGRGVEQDYREAFSNYEKSAFLCDFLSQYMVGYFYEQGLGVSCDYAKAAYWYEQAILTGDYSDAEFALACMYLAGKGVDADEEKAVAYFEKAKSYLDECAGGMLDLLRNGTEALKTVAKNAILGDAEAQVKMGDVFKEGKKNFNTQDYIYFASKWYRKAAVKGNVEAMVRLADLYYYDWFYRDYETSLYWFERASIAGNEYASEMLDYLNNQLTK